MQARHPVVLLVTVALCLTASDAAWARLPLPTDAPSATAKSKKRKKKRKQPPAPPADNTASMHVQRPRYASPVEAPDPAKPSLELQRHTLRNGLRVVLHPEPSLPVVAVSVSYLAGSSFESADQQGFARAVFHHLRVSTASDPSAPSLPPADAVAGADLMSFTTVVPPNRTHAVLWREAHRVAHAIDATTFATLRNDLAASGPAPSRLRVEQLAYQGCWAYEHAAFGWTGALQHADADVLEAFRRRLIAPNRAVIAVTGRFDPAAMLEDIRGLFGEIPAVVPSATPSLDVPDQINQRVDLEKSSQPIHQHFLYGWAVPPAGHPDLPAVRLAVAMLRDRTRDGFATRSDRFAKLPDEAKLAINLDVRKGLSLLTLRVDFPASLDMDETREVIDDAMLDLAMHGPTPEEMRTAWRDAQLDWLDGLGATDRRAETLARTELLVQDASTVARVPAELVASNRGQVQRAVQNYLTPIRRNLVEKRGPKVEPPPRAAAAEGKKQPTRTGRSKAAGSKSRGSKRRGKK